MLKKNPVIKLSHLFCTSDKNFKPVVVQALWNVDTGGTQPHQL